MSTPPENIPDPSGTDRDLPTTGPLTGWRVLVPRPPLDPTPTTSPQVAREQSSTTPPHAQTNGSPPHQVAREQSSTTPQPAALTGSLSRTPEGGGPAASGSSPAAIALLAAGAEPVVVPLVRTVPVDDLTPLDDALLALGAGWYSWLTVTSQAAVAVLAERASAHDDGLAALLARADVRVAAVGPGTARALESLGVRVDVVPPVRSTAVDLVAALVGTGTPATPGAPAASGAGTSDASGPRALFPRGDLAAATLADGLTAAGWAVDDLVVYRTVPAGPPDPQVAQAWAAGDVHAALLTSASTVRALLDHLGPPPAATRVVVIGPSTQAEADRLGLRVDAVAARQTLTGLVDALTHHVARTGATPGAPPALDTSAPGSPTTPSEDTP